MDEVRVKVHYSAFDMEGNIFASSLDGDPLELQPGLGVLPKIIEDKLLGMTEGQEFTQLIRLDPDMPHPLAGQEVIYEIRLVQIL